VVVIFKDGTVTKLDLPQDISQVQSITLSGDGIVALAGSYQKLTLTQEWLRSGTPVYLHVHSHPGPEGDPASFALDTVTVGR
jgi:hypothetical protein